MFTLFRKFVKMVRGGASSWQIIVSCMLGVMIGMIPGFNALTFALLVLFAIVNLSLGLMLIGVVVGKAMCLALAPYTYEIGYVIIHNMGLEGLFAQAYQTPFVALMGLDLYCLVGGIPIAMVVGFIIGGMIARTIKLLRIGSMAAAAKSVRIQKLTSNTFSRLTMRILFGKQKKSLAEMLAFKHPILRKSGIILLLIIVGLVVAFEMFFINDMTRSAVIGGIESGTGAEVNLKTASLSLTGGELKLDGLQVTDARQPTHNTVNANKLHAKISIAELLTGRAVIDELVIGEVLPNVKRDKEGKVYRQPPPVEEGDGEFSLSDYFENKDRILDYLAKIKDYLEKQEQQRKEQKERTSEETRGRADEMAANRGYLKASAAGLLAERPMITIRKIRIEKFPVPQIGDCVIDIKELSSNLALNELPMTLAAKSDKGFDASGVIDFITEGAMHQLKVLAPNLKVAAMGLSEKCPIDIKEALATLRLDGKFNSKTLALPFQVQLSKLQSAVQGDGKVLGFDAKTAGEMFKSITRLDLVAVIEGAVDSPDVKVDVGKTVASLKGALMEAGKAQLANMAGERLKKVLPGGLPIDPGGIIKDPGSIIKDPGSLLKGKTSEGGDKTPSKNPLDALKNVVPGKNSSSTTKPKAPAGGLLDGLRL